VNYLKRHQSLPKSPVVFAADGSVVGLRRHFAEGRPSDVMVAGTCGRATLADEIIADTTRTIDEEPGLLPAFARSRGPPPSSPGGGRSI